MLSFLNVHSAPRIAPSASLSPIGILIMRIMIMILMIMRIMIMTIMIMMIMIMMIMIIIVMMMMIMIMIVMMMSNTSIMEFDPTTAKGTRFLIQASSVFPFKENLLEFNFFFFYFKKKI